MQFSGCNSKESQRRADWHSQNGKICELCEEKKKKQERDEAIAFSLEHGLPELVGSDKQIDWAIVIRHKRIITYSFDWFEQNQAVLFESCELEGENQLDAFDCFVTLLQVETDVRQWIDNRDLNAESLFKKTLPLTVRKLSDSKPEAVKVLEEATVRPKEPASPEIAEVIVDARFNHVLVHFPNRFTTLTEIMHQLFFRWNGKLWVLECSVIDGALLDRAAEVVNHILAKNIIVKCLDVEVKEKALAGEFKPRYPRWVVNQGGKFAVHWFDDNHSLFNELRVLNDADKRGHYEHKKWLLPCKYVDIIEDMISRHLLHVSPGAKALIKSTKEAHESQLLKRALPVSEGIDIESVEPVLENIGIDKSLLDD
ncbi:MAG: hypothetical protein ACJAYB_000053 [Psychromonas sp.]|jgi:hypothetical protein